jgi:hypothetical protein
MQIPKRRLKKELHRQLMRSGPKYQKEGMTTKEMNIQEDILPSGIKEASIRMKETTEEYIMNPNGLHHKEGHLLQGIKISFSVIVILAKKMDIRQLIVESMKGSNMEET